MRAVGRTVPRAMRRPALRLCAEEEPPPPPPQPQPPSAPSNGNDADGPIGSLARRKWPQYSDYSDYADDAEYVLMEDISRPYWRRETRVQFVGQWPVGDPRANPGIGGRQGLRSIQYFRGLRDDFKRKSPLYLSDWADGFRSISSRSRRSPSSTSRAWRPSSPSVGRWAPSRRARWASPR